MRGARARWPQEIGLDILNAWGAYQPMSEIAGRFNHGMADDRFKGSPSADPHRGFRPHPDSNHGLSLLAFNP